MAVRETKSKPEFLPYRVTVGFVVSAVGSWDDSAAYSEGAPCLIVDSACSVAYFQMQSENHAVVVVVVVGGASYSQDLQRPY